MSDTRRRRKSNQSCGSDELSDSCEELNATKETQSSEQTDGHQDSECDIYPSDSDAESQDGAQRESGDGQEEEKPQKKLDDDEDRRNPQYIPKRGTFYEHDDRTVDEVEDSAAEPQNERETKEKKVWKDKEDRWDHDRYNDEEQAPKSHEELIAVYGYDIRNEEGPPRARRRRRYGRGPNKYTRNWEDEDAYGKPGSNVPARNKKFNRSAEEFPALGTNKNAPKVDEPVISSAWYSSKNKSQIKGQNFPPLQTQADSPKTKSLTTSNTHTNENKAPNEPTNPAWKKDTKQSSHAQSSNGNSGPGGDADKLAYPKMSPRDNNKKNVQESATNKTTRGRGFRLSVANNNMVANKTIEAKSKGHGAGPVIAENRRNSSIQNDDEQQITHDMKHVSVNDGNQYHQRHNKNFYGLSSNQQRSSTVPPRMQQQSHSQQQQPQQQQQQQAIQQQDGAANRPKRYSSLRQRPTISDNAGQQSYPPQHGQHGQHSQHNQHNQQCQHNQHGYFPPQGYPQGHFEQSTPVAAAAAPLAGQPVIPIPPNGQPTSFAPPAFLVPPPQFIPPQTAPPSIINYVPGPNGPTFPPNFQGYQGYSPPVQPPRPPPPQELFQPQGCTYYSPAQQQQQQQQSAPVRRPKAAIPILPPPEQVQTRGRGRMTQSPQMVQAGGVQQFGQEMKANSVEDDQKTVPEQFDDVEETEVREQPEKNEDLSVLITDTVVENDAQDMKSSDTDMPVNSEHVVADQLDGTIVDTNDLSKGIIDEEKIISLKTPQTVIEDVKDDSSKIEKAASESTVIEEAVA